MKNIFLFCLSLMLSGYVYASEDAGNFYIGVQIGAGDMDINNAYSLINGDESSSTTEQAFLAGYKFKNNILLELSLASNDSLNFFGANDTYDLSQQHLLIGYAFNFSKGFRITPKLGRTKLELNVKEGQFLNPGVEARIKYDGYGTVFMAEFEKSISEDWYLGLTFTRLTCEFGDANSTRFGAKYEF